MTMIQPITDFPDEPTVIVRDPRLAESGKPDNVITALAKVMSELGGIDKMTAADRQRRGMGGGDTGISYAYRGIDQIAGAAQPLLGKHGVVVVPEIIDSRVDQITVNNKPWTDTWVRVKWTVYGPGGVLDRVHAITEGLGRDNADKGPNKAMTAAAKNLLLRLLMIGDSSDDSDGHTAERDQVTEARPAPLSDNWIAQFRATVEDAGFDPAVVMWSAFGNTVPNPLMPEHIPTLRDAFARVKDAGEPDATPNNVNDENGGGMAVAELPLSDEPAEPEPATISVGLPGGEVRPATPSQIGRIKAEYNRLRLPRDAQIEMTGLLLGRDIVSHNQLNADEAERLLDQLKERTPETAGRRG